MHGYMREEILGDCLLTDEAQFDDKLSFPCRDSCCGFREGDVFM